MRFDLTLFLVIAATFIALVLLNASEWALVLTAFNLGVRGERLFGKWADRSYV